MMKPVPSPAWSSCLPTSGNTKSPSDTMRTVPSWASASEVIAVPVPPPATESVDDAPLLPPPFEATTTPPITSAATATPPIAMSGPFPFLGGSPAPPAGTPGKVSRLGPVGVVGGVTTAAEVGGGMLAKPALRRRCSRSWSRRLRPPRGQALAT